ncbi:hypothetical protein [Alloactinosynnema sp. L-07]|uniref:integrase n=1 Tax=Alloactinosynnema sp. L-07 TaxID=1653480 RepID=UPI00065EFB51|nr:integrase [Alloactinosynnema sp. L-07]CRK56931.1 hypothetical protein [Alloactinosynnema sp. L-07]
MTSPALTTEHIAGLPITPTSPVIVNRTLHPDADLTMLPAFGDPWWDLTAALPDRHSPRPRIYWDRFPEQFMHACKLYVFALVNLDEPRMTRSRPTIPAIKTLYADLAALQFFLAWLADRGITAFAEVTDDDLNAYLNHLTDLTARTSDWKRKKLLAVQRLHAYRDTLPPRHRLPAPRPWGGATAGELAEHEGHKLRENRTPRIHPDVMHPLLSAALLVSTTIAADLLPTARRLVAMRHLAHQVAPDSRRQPGLIGTARRRALLEHCRGHLLPALTAAGLPLPGRRLRGMMTIDIDGLTVGGWLDRVQLRKFPALRDAIADSGLPVKVNWLRVTGFTTIGHRTWRSTSVEATELVELLRHVTTACFLVTAYLSGIRTGEALNLRRGCITHDTKLGQIFLSGQQMKTSDDRRERSPRTIPWVVTEPVAHAISVLEDLTPGPVLFPLGEFCSPQWIDASRHSCRRSSSITANIAEFIAWFNSSIVPTTGHPTIGEDPEGSITAPRLRRTLAWHIVRKPGGTIAGATQYGHLHTNIIRGYAGNAASGFLDEITFEEFLLRAETLHDDHQRLTRGEHVSGPAADTYKDRVAAASRFAGLTITTPAQVNNALANPDLQVHHGALLTCVYRPATAACQDDGTGDGPVWGRCRLTCRNAARTDRDITALRDHVRGLTADLDGPVLPDPLRRRVELRLAEHQRALTEHETTRPAPTPTIGVPA